MLSLSYVGLAMALGHSIDIPFMTRSLAQHFEDCAEENFLLTRKFVDYLVSGSLDTPDSHIGSFILDWWNDSPKKRDKSRILCSKTLYVCVEYHLNQLRMAAIKAERGVGPSVPPPSAPLVVPPVPTAEEKKLLKPFYGWHTGTFDLKGSHCDKCRLYRTITLGVWDKLRDLRNLTNTFQSVHTAERTLSERAAAGFNLLYEEAVKMETAKEKASSAGTASSSSTTAAAAAAGTLTSPDSSSKWTWGVDLDESHIRGMVRAADSGFVLPHSGYDDSLGDFSLPSESEGPSPSVHRQLDDEIINRPSYEPLSSDIRYERELTHDEIPIAFNNFPLNPGATVNSKSPKKRSFINPLKEHRMWLPPPPSEYVELPIPHPSFTNPPPPTTTVPGFRIGTDVVSAIYIGSDDEPAAKPNPENIDIAPTSIYVDSDTELLTDPPMHKNLDDSPVIDAALTHICFKDSPVMDDPQMCIYLEDSPIPEIYVPSEDDEAPDDIYLEDSPSQLPAELDVYIADTDNDETAGTATALGPISRNTDPYTPADFADFDDSWLDD